MKTSSGYNSLVVSTDGTASPYIAVAPEQLEPVLQALRGAKVSGQVEADALQQGGMSVLSVINLDSSADLKHVQEILDRVAVELAAKRGRKASVPMRHKWIVQGDPEAMREFARRFDAELLNGWVRRIDLEDRLKKSRLHAPVVYCFAKVIEPSMKEFVVLLDVQGTREMVVSSIIPLNGSDPAEIDQHSNVRADFQKTLLEPLMRGLKVRIFNYARPAEPTLEEILSLTALEQLRAFSATANRSALTSRDNLRWQAFITRTHLDNSVISPALLSAWLEEEDWPEEQRSQLVSAYEAGRGLLSVYDEELAAT